MNKNLIKQAIDENKEYYQKNGIPMDSSSILDKFYSLTQDWYTEFLTQIDLIDHKWFRSLGFNVIGLALIKDQNDEYDLIEVYEGENYTQFLSFPPYEDHIKTKKYLKELLLDKFEKDIMMINDEIDRFNKTLTK